MRLPAPERRDRGEPIAPLINVVFLLLIFFLISATIAAPDPIEVTPPQSASPDDLPRQNALLIDAAGDLAYGELRGEAVFARIAGQDALTVKADARAPAARLVEILGKLRANGIADVELVVEAQ